jgi:hypothetical protein
MPQKLTFGQFLETHPFHDLITPLDMKKPGLITLALVFLGGGVGVRRYETYLQFNWQKLDDNKIARLSKNLRTGHFTIFCGL